jgi:hypothetical protein
VSELAGAVVWAVVPFAPEAPFRLYAGVGHEPIEMPTPDTLVAAASDGGDPQFTYLVPGKARPVLVLSDAHDDDLGEYLALRLSRFTKLTADEQRSIRAQRHPTLFHLHPKRFALPEENAAMIAGLLRIHRSAVQPRICGRLDEYELTTVHERVVRFYGFNIRQFVEERLQELARLQRSGKEP